MQSDSRQTLVLDRAEKMVNKLLSLDEEVLDALATLEGKVIAVDIMNTDIKLFIFPSAKGINLVSEYDDKADVSIKAAPFELLRMFILEEMSAGDVEISGSVGLAHELQSILKKIDIDWEEYLAKITGDIVAHKVGNFIKEVRQYAGGTAKTIALDVSEYLRYEKAVLLDKSELDEFYHAVDKVCNDVERLQQRMVRLGKEQA